MNAGDAGWYLLLGAVLGLAACVLVDAVQIGKLQADVAFLYDVSRVTDAARKDA